MSNLYTRVRYDAAQLTAFDKTNKNANELLLDESVKENNVACYAPAGSGNALSQVPRPMNGTRLDFGQKADIENRVMNRHMELNNNEGRTNKDHMTNIGTVPSMCNIKETFANENSRFTNPVENYREMYTAPYAFSPYLYVSPQAVTANNNAIMTPNRYGESSRYSAKTAQYDLKPKQYASINTPINYTDLVSGLLPTKATGATAYTN